MLDGQELIWCTPGMDATSCAAGGQYTTKDESFLKITTPDGAFHVYGRDGTHTVLSLTVMTSPGGFRYGQTSVTDTKGNSVSYQWTPMSGDDAYPSLISYNGYSVAFYNESRPDVLSFAAWDHVGTTLYRIRSIAVRQGSSLVRAYKLSYATSAATGRSLLTSVQMFGKDASVDANGAITGRTSLPAQTFTYQNDAIAHQFTPTTSGSGTSWCGQDFLRTGDFNGDGKTDLLCAYAGTRVALSNGAGFDPPTTWSTLNAEILGDFNNDGKTDFAYHYSGEGDTSIHVALSTGSQFQAPVQWAYIQNLGSCWIHTGDFDGNGFADIWCRGWGGTPHMVGLSTGSSFSFSSWGDQGSDDAAFVIDINGDRRDDWISMSIDGYVSVFRSTGTSFAYPTSWYIGYCDPVLGDLNGDGRTDIACLADGRVFRATDSLFVESAPAGAFCAGTTDRFAADVDGDGASEIVCNNPGSPANDIEVRKWNGTALGNAETWLGASCSDRLFAGDFNGDGKTDVTCGNSAISFAKAGTGGFQADLMQSASNGLGGTVQAAYTSSSGFSNTNGPPPKWAITSLTRLDGRGGSATTNYTYGGGLMDRVEGKFLGFRFAHEIFPANLGEASRPYNKYFFRQDLNSAGKLEYLYRLTGSDVYMDIRVNSYSTNGSALPRKSFLTGELVYHEDGTGVYCAPLPCSTTKLTQRVHTYDLYGNVTRTDSNGDVFAAGDETTSTTDFYPNTSAYIVDRPARARTFAGTGTAGTVLSDRLIYYDGSSLYNTPPAQGYPTVFLDWLNTQSRWVTSSTTGYDSFGNPTSVVDATGRTVATAYDSTHHVFPTSVTNGANETVTTAWDPLCGVPTSTTNANGQVATFAAADALCRPTTTTDPLGGFESRSYLSLGDPNTQRTRIETPSPDGSGNDWAEAYFDGWGRTWKTVKRGPWPNPVQDIITETTFHPRSGIATQTEAHYTSETPRTTSYTYDALDRVTLTKILPNTTVSTMSYGLWATTANDPNGNSVTTRFDAYGRQKQVERTLNGGPVLTNYTYDLLGRLTGMSDHLGHQWSWTFDTLGRNTQKGDPDAGTWSFVYDDAGRLTSQTDAKSQTISFAYDPQVGRLTTKTAPGETVTTAYSEPRTGFFNVGLPTTITSPASVLKLDYDALGRVVKQTRTLDSINYVLTRTYDSGGFLRGITYPDGDQVGTPQNPLGYDSAGRLTLVPGILNQVTYDASGRPLVQTNANGTATTRTYSADRGFLTRILTTPGTPPIQDLQYTMDTPGSVGLVSQVTSPHPNEGWSYGYDDLYRLTTSTNLSTPAESQTFQYDVIGRITNNSRVGSYTYPSVGQPRPHAPQTAGGNSYGYDLNGNMTTGAGRTLTWDANNRLSQATLASTTTNFTYDDDGDRLKKVTAASTSLYPLGDDDYEITGGVITKYFSMYGVSIAKKVGSGGGAQTFWLHTDRLGSVQAITDATGSLVQRRTYRPYGEKIADSTGHVESKGWINERHDSETKLTYLHARYYDPELGTFISPDPMHPDSPGVGLNRFAYAFGNPVNGIDRSGLADCNGEGTFYDNNGHERRSSDEELCDLEDDGPRGGPVPRRGGGVDCTKNPSDPRCTKPPVDCATNPTDPSCTKPPVDCTTNPTDPSCTKPPIDCATNPTDPSCTKPPVDCKANPTDPACKGGDTCKPGDLTCDPKKEEEKFARFAQCVEQRRFSNIYSYLSGASSDAAAEASAFAHTANAAGNKLVGSTGRMGIGGVPPHPTTWQHKLLPTGGRALGRATIVLTVFEGSYDIATIAMCAVE